MTIDELLDALANGTAQKRLATVRQDSKLLDENYPHLRGSLKHRRHRRVKPPSCTEHLMAARHKPAMQS